MRRKRTLVSSAQRSQDVQLGIACAGLQVSRREKVIFQNLKRRCKRDGCRYVSPAVNAAHEEGVILVGWCIRRGRGIHCYCGGARRFFGRVVVHPHGQGLLCAHIDASALVGAVEYGVKAGAADTRCASGCCTPAAGKHARCSMCETKCAALEERFLGDDGDAAVENDADGGRTLDAF